MATVAELAEELALEAGEQYDDIDISAMFHNWVEQAVEDIYTLAPWFFKNALESLTTAASTRVYSLPATATHIRDMVVATAPAGDPTAAGEHITYAPVERLIARSKILTAEGRPLYWYFEGMSSTNQIQVAFQPVPDDVYVLDVPVLKAPPSLSGSSTIPVPPEYLNAIREKVRSLLKFSENDNESAGLKVQEFEKRVGILNERFQGRARGGSRMRVKGIKAQYQTPSTPGGD